MPCQQPRSVGLPGGLILNLDSQGGSVFDAQQKIANELYETVEEWDL